MCVCVCGAWLKTCAEGWRRIEWVNTRRVFSNVTARVVKYRVQHLAEPILYMKYTSHDEELDWTLKQ